jgi:amino acid transporter
MRAILALFFVALVVSLWLYPLTTPVLGTFLLLFTLAISVWAIFKKHKRTEKPRLKIAKDILTLVATILLITLLGGLAGMSANYYASLRFGVVWGVISALVASFVVGYLVRWGVGKLGRRV